MTDSLHPVLLVVGTAFAAALIGSLHCLGMCGGFAAAVSAFPGTRARRTTLFARHGAYHAGKITSYLFLGGVAAVLGRSVHGLQGAQVALSVLAGLLMLGIGLQLLGLLPARRTGALTAWFAAAFAPLTRAEGFTGTLALGVFNGLLPCPLVYAFVAQAAAAGSFPAAMGIMLGLGLGTIPALSVAGVAGRALTAVRQRALRRIAGVLLLVFGILTLARGLAPLTGVHVHEHSTHPMRHGEHE